MCYVPTNDAREEVKYEKFKNVLGNNRPQRKLSTFMGDMIDKIASCNIGYEGAIGKHGLGDKTNNGKRLHKRVHKATWVSTNHTAEIKVDHLCI